MTALAEWTVWLCLSEGLTGMSSLETAKPSSDPSRQLAPETSWSLVTAALVAIRALRLHAADAREAERRAWLRAVADALHIAVEALPDSPTEGDIQRLPAVPAGEHAAVLKLLVLASLHVSEHLPSSGAAMRKAGPPTDAKGVASVDTAYSALSRTLVYRTAELLHIPAAAILSAEQAVAADLYALYQQQAGASTDSMSAAGQSAVASAKSASTAWKWAATGAGAILGGVAIGLTGGLAAPLIVGASGGLVRRTYCNAAEPGSLASSQARAERWRWDRCSVWRGPAWERIASIGASRASTRSSSPRSSPSRRPTHPA